MIACLSPAISAAVFAARTSIRREIQIRCPILMSSHKAWAVAGAAFAVVQTRIMRLAHKLIRIRLPIRLPSSLIQAQGAEQLNCLGASVLCNFLVFPKEAKLHKTIESNAVHLHDNYAKGRVLSAVWLYLSYVTSDFCTVLTGLHKTTGERL
jgi:hypothetical protein